MKLIDQIVADNDLQATKRLILKTLEEESAREQEGIDLFKRIKKATTKFQGKKITKAIATAVEKELSPDGYVVYYSPGSMLQITVWKGHSDNAKRFLLAYQSNPIFRMGKSSEQHSGIEYFCNCYGDAALERNAKREKLIKDDETITRMASAINKLKEAQAELGVFSDMEFPGWYAIAKATGVKE